ncbi:MAG: hypothetical protein WEE20_13980 [Bacteroidota bacterium]
MPANQLLNEFAQLNPDELSLRMTELFDSLLRETDESATESIKTDLERFLQERIDALEKD